MSIAKLNFSFKVSGISGSFNIDTQQNVKKNIADILYLEYPPADAINLYYVGAKELNALRNVFIADRSTSIYENNKSNETEYIGLYTGTISLKNTNFLVTQEFIEAESGFIPMYYKHSLPFTTYLDSIRVFDKEFKEVNLVKIVAIPERDEDTGTPTGSYLRYDVFNNYESFFNYNTADYEVYFIQYSYDDSGTKKTLTTLLDNKPAYHQATWEDYWSETFYLKPWGTAYNINENLLLQLPTNTAFAIKYTESKRLSVKTSSLVDNEQPWFLRISNSSFSAGFYNYGYKYSVPEFSNQSFNPIQPYKQAIRERSYKITDRLIALPAQNIQEGLSFSKIKTTLEKDGNVEYAITNDTSLNGIAYVGIDGKRSINTTTGKPVYWDSDNFLSYDKLSGIIYVGIDVDDSYDIYSTFSYQEEYYTLTGLNINPIFNQDATEHIYCLYVVPESSLNGNLGTQTASVMWLKISRSGVILDCNQDGSNNNENIKQEAILSDVSGYNLDGVIGLHFGWRANTESTSSVSVSPGATIPVESTATFPSNGWLRAKDNSVGTNYRYFRYISKTDTSFLLDNSANYVSSFTLVDSGEIELVNFIDERTTSTIRSAENEVAYFSGNGQSPIFSRYFILAEVSVNQPHGIHDLSIIDVRQNGAGIIEDKYEEAKNINPEIQWYSDFNGFSGQVLPGNAALVIKLPISLLDDYTIDELKEIINNRVPAGVYPIMKFYGYQPRIISVNPIASGITINWEKEGDDFTYDIWYSTGESGPWIQANTSPIVDDLVESFNSYTISGLSSEAIYSVRITITDNYSY